MLKILKPTICLTLVLFLISQPCFASGFLPVTPTTTPATPRTNFTIKAESLNNSYYPQPHLNLLINACSEIGEGLNSPNKLMFTSFHKFGAHLIYDGDRVIEERDSSNQLIASYVYGTGIDEILQMNRGGNQYYYHYDGLGSVSDITDSNGYVVENYSYDVYGNPSQLSTIGNRNYFTGREYDQESGLYYYRARMYSPVIGRFMQRDPIGYYAGMNLYSYVSNNPIKYIDPYGLWNILIGVGGSAAGGMGGEGSGGIVISFWQGQLDIGVFGSVGASGGLNVSADVFIGWFQGGTNNLAGTTANLNLSVAQVSVSSFYNMQSGSWLGGTLGLGPGATPIGGSVAVSKTGKITIGDIFYALFSFLYGLGNKSKECQTTNTIDSPVLP